MTCAVSVQLGDSLILDDTTATSGIVFGYTSLAGWWDGAPVRIAKSEVQPEGETITAARRNGRPLVLAGSAYAVGGRVPLDLLAYSAARLITQRSRFVHIPGLLKVTEPALAAQAYVRLIDRVRTRIDPDLLAVTFEIPLLAPDPNKYAQAATVDTQLTLTGAATGIGANIVHVGDANSSPIITIDGPATNPLIQSQAIAGVPALQWTGVLGSGDTLVFDVAAATVKLNGLNAHAALTARGWWRLVPGNNVIEYFRSAGSGTSTAQLTYRAAYE